MANALYNKGWVLLQPKGDYEFITSDSPIMAVNINSLEATPFRNGLALDDTIISFSVSPTILLMLYSKNKFYGYFNKKD